MIKVYIIEMLLPLDYSVWQPWLKGYSGEVELAIGGCSAEEVYWLCWVDQDLKEAMTGKR